MNYKKLILVGCISAFVAILTTILGVAGTVIGSVISSVLYNMLSEALEHPVSNASFKPNFEWEIAYVFPLVVIAIIQLLLIFALLAESGLLPYGFVNFYMIIQNLVNNNLYRILGLALLVISAYPIVLKPEFVKKEHGIILVFVGLIFLARGFVDAGNFITNLYDAVFRYFDLPIAIIAFILLSVVILRILHLAGNSDNDAQPIQHNPINKTVFHDAPKYVHHKAAQTDYANNQRTVKKQYPKRTVRHSHNRPQQSANVKFNRNIRENNQVSNQKPQSGVNKSSDKIHFESNDLLDDYKK